MHAMMDRGLERQLGATIRWVAMMEWFDRKDGEWGTQNIMER